MFHNGFLTASQLVTQLVATESLLTSFVATASLEGLHSH